MPNTFGATPQIDKFLDWRYGLFVHWNPSSVIGHEISWSRENDKPEQPHKPRAHTVSPRTCIPAELYDSLYRYFDASHWDARDFVAKAKAWGFRYIYLTTKHHDGFCNFDTDLTDYKVTSSSCPAGRDLTREYVDACRELDMGLGIYYSQPDWHHPDYRTENHDRYIQYLHAQIEELCTRYGKIDVWWFDGLTANEKGDNHVTGLATPAAYHEEPNPGLWDAEALLKKMRAWQPDMVINDRCVLQADFYTPEQRVGGFDPENPWESSMTIGGQWAYSFDEVVKSSDEMIGHVVDAACGGGNFVLNVGPDRHGLIPPEQERVLNQIAAWMDAYGHTIYGTRGGPYPRWRWGGATHDGNTIYVHVRRWPELQDRLTLPLGGARPQSVTLLTGEGLTYEVEGDLIHLDLGLQNDNALDNIVEMKLDKLPVLQ
ncbi:alpha-L-fucosidase [Pelagovum pacificum]|uniref:alpha-L-fucosidase n=1 Tax=Pelagovum pacificum TaxID=2588711 RepID=A0A5C5GAN0_9RHOB|nr:alpha-L-fucosidase [Pelagovum pacificum]QQA41459.1 alpha-L-fucosidase [Pelagovum pacificum]TNY31738.1 hypothetical protein FHY64_00085 [Pelagovum pacificum]